MTKINKSRGDVGIAPYWLLFLLRSLLKYVHRKLHERRISEIKCNFARQTSPNQNRKPHNRSIIIRIFLARNLPLCGIAGGLTRPQANCVRHIPRQFLCALFLFLLRSLLKFARRKFREPRTSKTKYNFACRKLHERQISEIKYFFARQTIAFRQLLIIFLIKADKVGFHNCQLSIVNCQLSSFPCSSKPRPQRGFYNNFSGSHLLQIPRRRKVLSLPRFPREARERFSQAPLF